MRSTSFRKFWQRFVRLTPNTNTENLLLVRSDKVRCTTGSRVMPVALSKALVLDALSVEQAQLHVRALPRAAYPKHAAQMLPR